jgi:DNA-binding NtrC family response regulator
MSNSQSHESKSKKQILVIEDDPTTSKVICSILASNGLNPVPVYTGAEAVGFFRSKHRVGAMLIDIALPDIDGIEILRMGRKSLGNIPCFMLTARDDPQTVVLAMKAGASDYFTKPVNQERLVAELHHALTLAPSAAPFPHSVIIDDRWKSPKMRQALDHAAQASLTFLPVIIQGQRYTGKSIIARIIHEASNDPGAPFRSFDLATMPPHVVESRLFGGSLVDSGGDVLRLGGALGRFAGGTLFLENIESLEPDLQKILVEWLMINSPPTWERRAARLIASSTADMEELMKTGGFRRDLWFLLAVHRIYVPSLAERLADLSILCNDIITQICVKARIRRPSLSQKAFEKLESHSWPYNLMELHNALEYAVAHTSDGLITPADLPTFGDADPLTAQVAVQGATTVSSIDEVTRASLAAALEACGGNRRKTAQRLKVSLRTVYNMIKRYDMQAIGDRRHGKRLVK